MPQKPALAPKPPIAQAAVAPKKSPESEEEPADQEVQPEEVVDGAGEGESKAELDKVPTPPPVPQRRVWRIRRPKKKVKHYVPTDL
jgi:hypothetical protein